MESRAGALVDTDCGSQSLCRLLKKRIRVYLGFPLFAIRLVVIFF